MARLTNLGAGDYADRLTILALKILHYGAAGKPVEHLQKERDALLVKGFAGPALGKGAVEALLELGAVNAELWAKTDQLRAVADDPRIGPLAFVTAGELGIRIMRLNDRRAELVDAINKATGEFLGAEKG